MRNTNWLCYRPSNDRRRFESILENLDIPDVYKQMIQARYITILDSFQRRVRNYSIIFHMGHMIITVGSLFVPALLSIQNSNATANLSNGAFPIQVYWATFIVSLLVTIFNGILTLFKIDKKYYFLNTTLERLRTEGWQYFGLTGRYAGQLVMNTPPSHVNQFIYFTHQIEKLKMKQVEEEYYKSDEKIENAPTGQNSHTKSTNELYPPSPDRPLASMTNVPDPVKEAVNSLIRAQNLNQDSYPTYSNPVYSAYSAVENVLDSVGIDMSAIDNVVHRIEDTVISAASEAESIVHNVESAAHNVVSAAHNVVSEAVSVAETILDRPS